MRIKKLAMVVGLSIGIVSITPAEAALTLRQITDGIYGSFTHSSGSTYTSNTGRHVFAGGAASLRFKQRPIQAISFRAPSASVSCGGIDFFAGSLSFAGRDELIQAGRNIASAATVYAFKLALNSVCASCNSIMTSIQNTVDAINKMAKTSCSQALEVMESWYDPENAKKWNSNSAMNKVSDKLTNNPLLVGADGEVPQYGSWLELLKKKKGADAKDDLAKEDANFMHSQSDVGFVIAYNTYAPMYLLPWLVENGTYDIDSPSNNSVAKATMWRLLSQGKSCADMENEQEEGVFCGLVSVADKMEWDMFSLIHGETDKDGKRLDKFDLPKCNTIISTELDGTGGAERHYCKFDVSNPVSTSGSVRAVVSQIYQDFFGEGSLTEDTNLPDVNKVCELNGINTAYSNSLFYKMLSLSTEPLTPTQSYLVSIMGQKYSFDLYKLNEKGEYINSIHGQDFSCGAAFNVAYERLKQVVQAIEDGSFFNTSIAIQSLYTNPRIPTGMIVQYEAVLKSLENRTRARFQTQRRNNIESKSNE